MGSIKRDTIDVIRGAARSVKREENYERHMYKDSMGIWTIGYGFNLEIGISEDLASRICEMIIEDRVNDVLTAWPWIENLTPARREVFYEMAYQMGVEGLSEFKDTLKAAEAGDIPGVVAGMKDSLWYRKQAKNRAGRLIKKYEKG